MNRANRERWAVSLTALAGFVCLAASTYALDRPADPVVFTGASIPSLQGIRPDELVGFMYDGSRWRQIPVQVDERATINFTQVYNGNRSYGSLSRLEYTDAGTFTGPDPDPTLDADDEIVFMAKDAGLQCTSGPEPAGVVARTGVEVAITDPLGGPARYVYLFRQSGALDPGAGAQYVDYQFRLLSGNYSQTYNLGGGGNPENSTITTDYYQRHFSDRWIDDELHITAGTATGVDILDRHKSLFAPGVCERSENTFSNGEGAFITNKSGPVRAIRNYLGANSGPRTQRQHIYYQAREDIHTFLRVHPISSVMDFFDYSPDAAGMTYYNNNLSSGVTIDGVQDTVPPGQILWELVTGAQGSLVMMSTLTADFSVTQSSYYLDSITPPDTQCTGDAWAYGSSGPYITSVIMNTDPMLGPFGSFQLDRIMYYDVPGLTLADAQHRKDLVDHPLECSFARWGSGFMGLPSAGKAGIGGLVMAVAILGAMLLRRSAVAINENEEA